MASAASCRPEYVDGAARLWSIQVDGSIDEAAIDAFDSWGALAVGAGGFANAGDGTCTLEDGDREVVYPEQTLDSLKVVRKVYVPAADTPFARLTTIITNPTAAPLSRAYVLTGNLGSDADTVVRGSSSGDAAATTADSWVVSDDSNNVPPTDYVVGTIFQGAGTLAHPADALTWGALDGAPTFTWNLTVPAGGTMVLVHFLTIAPVGDVALASSRATAISTGIADGLFAGMSAAEIAAMQNWGTTDFDGDGVPNTTDTCDYIKGGDQTDTDADGNGNLCDLDDDGDGWEDTLETKLGTSSTSGDSDTDGVADAADKCPTTKGTGTDGCGVGGDQVAACPAGNSPKVLCVTGVVGGLFIVGTAGNDTIIGASKADTIYGRGGNDTINANGGADTVYGGLGNDTINANGGADTVFGGAGNDKVLGGLGNDVLRGEAGKDTLNGGAGNDRLFGGLGVDRLIGGPGRNVQVQ